MINPATKDIGPGMDYLLNEGAEAKEQVDDGKINDITQKTRDALQQNILNRQPPESQVRI